MNAQAPIRARYPTKANIRRAVETARELNIDVAGYEIGPDGTVRVLDARRAPRQLDESVEDEIARGRKKRGK